jgi:hypothetical protein
MRKLLNRKIVEQDRKCAICHEGFTDYNDVVEATKIPKEWEEPGETITQPMSVRRIGGATGKKDRGESATERPISPLLFVVPLDRLVARVLWANGVHDLK